MDLENMGLNEKLNLAGSDSTPSEILRELAKDDDDKVRETTAYNINTPEDGLSKLATDRDWAVRYYLAQNPKASSKILVKLFEHEKKFKEPKTGIIRRLYANPKLPHVAKVIIETLFREML